MAKYSVPLFAITSYNINEPHLIIYKLGVLVAAMTAGAVYHTYRTYLHYTYNKPNYAEKRIQRQTLSLPPLNYSDNPRIIKLLIDHQADVNITDNNSNTALMSTIKKYNYITDIRADRAFINTMLKKIRIISLAGAHLNYFNDDGESPLMAADKPDQYVKEILLASRETRHLIIPTLNALQHLLQPGNLFEQIFPDRNIAYIIVGYSLPNNVSNQDENVHWTSYLGNQGENVQWMIQSFIKNSPELTKAQAWISKT